MVRVGGIAKSLNEWCRWNDWWWYNAGVRANIGGDSKRLWCELRALGTVTKRRDEW